ncbi:MAG: type IV secretion protein IcmL [Micavibrio aeruginosavorus]|uniref:Type IV secretion protein IcmL n=1 Tax=Micavibrio aeruginosavorus TaxID=349221 RepID=A0A2W5FU14_9BACT|nr:MAG: type IV secretion protein IcmL [Micavibrio aeruginosavorus]
MSDASTNQTRPVRTQGPGTRAASTKPRPPENPVVEEENTGGLGSVVIRNEFYRDGYRTLLKIALIEGVIIIGLILAMFYVISSNKPQDRYFATTNDGRLVPMVSLNEPNLSTPALMSWTAQSATEVMTFGFHDYRRRLQEASRNFTRLGWASFTTALEKSRIMETVEQNQQVLTAAPTSAPVLISEGVVNGRYQWQVELPMVITYQAGALRRADNLVLTLLIVRVSKLESPNGVGIEQWIAQPR